MHSGQLTESLEILIAWFNWIPVLPIFLLFSLIGLVVGVLIALNPISAMEIQRKFYEKINWRIEPVSISKEIRNTQAMGWFLCFVILAVLMLALSNKSVFF